MENIVKTYPCGLRLIVRPMPNFKSIATSVHISVGTRDEQSDEFGLAHFCEHMLFKGTKTRTAEQISQTLSNLGVQVNAHTGDTGTCYHTKGLLTNLDECCDVLSDMYFNSQFSDDDFRREAEVIVQEIKMCDDNPRHSLSELCMETFFAGTGYGHSIAGTVKSVRGFKPQDVRNFIKKHYTAPNTIISIAGNITLEQAERVVTKYWLKNLKDRAKPKTLAPVPENSHNPKPTVGAKKKKTEQQWVAVLFPVVHQTHPDKYPLVFVDGILTQDMSSRMFLSVREKLGLVYAIHGGLDLVDLGGYYYIWFSCVPQNTQKVLDTIAGEIEKFKTDGATDEEMHKVKNINRARRLFESEDVERINERIVEQLADIGSIETAEQFLAKIDKVTAKDVQNVAQKYLDMKNATICVVGKNTKIRVFA